MAAMTKTKVEIPRRGEEEVFLNFEYLGPWDHALASQDLTLLTHWVTNSCGLDTF